MLLSFTGLAAFFTTVTLPVILSEQWLTASWAVQAAVMLWIAAKLRSEFLRQVSYLLYGIVLLRFGFHDLPGQYGRHAALAADTPLLEYALALLQRLLTFGLPIASLAVAYRLIQRKTPPAALACDASNDIQPWLGTSRAVQWAFVVGAGMLFLFLHLELNQTFGYLYPPLRLPVLTLLWLGMSLALLLRCLAAPSQGMATLFWLFVAAVLLKLLFFDLDSWDLTLTNFWAGGDSWTLLYGGEYSFLQALLRLLDFSAIIAFFGFAFLSLSRRGIDGGMARPFFGAAALGLLFVFLTLELNTALHQYVPGLRSGGVSILWSLFALACVLGGIRRNVRALRLAGLGLFALVAWKVFFIDLARLDQIYRIVAFIVLGMLALGGSFVYMKYRQVFTSQAQEESQS